MAQGNFKKGAGAPKVKGKAGKGNVAAKSRRLVNKGKTAVKKGGEILLCVLSSPVAGSHRTRARYEVRYLFCLTYYTALWLCDMLLGLLVV